MTFPCVMKDISAYLHFSAFLFISLHFSTFLSISSFLYISLHFSAMFSVSLHFTAFLCISLHFSAFLFISLHISAFLCISSFIFQDNLMERTVVLWTPFLVFSIALIFFSGSGTYSACTTDDGESFWCTTASETWEQCESGKCPIGKISFFSMKIFPFTLFVFLK